MTPEDRDTITRGGSVTPERFARVRAIFEAAVSRPDVERLAFIDDACNGDSGLQREVEAMLAADRGISAPSSGAPEEGRFRAGTVLAGRYRILGLLGHGGMGEVYKAFDLILNQTVALKFLAPGHISEAALVRFRNEVRIARQVSHPNVCRVYDLGMVEGLHFLSMEYIDGEDLASLLRRIGRLPQDKAIEFTRKICAGLSAAHERGVLHRDLKPANIMIDGRGHVRITDFGLAGLAAEIPLSDLRSGTPAYMSPEQKSGKEVTTRSDIYSLGLVLHEMFTGKARHETQSSPTNLVKELDPTIERLILRCLEEDPKRRPNSALNIAMALPGADPIAAALAAGETPSPEMVAASQEKEGFTPRIGIICFLATVAFLALELLSSPISTGGALLTRAPLEDPPDALAFRAQEVLKQLGYSARPKVTAYGFNCCDTALLDSLEAQGPVKRDAILGTHQPPVINFWYRQHDDELRTFGFPPSLISYDDPPNIESGMIRLQLDAKGRLWALEARPPGTELDALPRSSTDWTGLLALTGLDLSRVTSVTPQRVPPVPFDSRAAWTATYSDHRSERLRVEAAWWQGQPVWLAISDDRSHPPEQFSAAFTLGDGISNCLLIIVFIAAPMVAWRNLKAGRGDRSGAGQFAGIAFMSAILTWIIGGPHYAGVAQFRKFLESMSWAVFIGVIVWCLYVAIEPYVRRNWPDSLISWKRFQAGRLRDPLVASHVLAGVVFTSGVGVALPFWIWSFGSGHLGIPLTATLNSVQSFAAYLISRVGFGAFLLVGMLLLVVLLRLLLRRILIADLVACFLMGGLVYGLRITNPRDYFVIAVMGFLSTAGTLWLLRRFGLVSVFSGFTMPNMYDVHLSVSTWYAGRSLVQLSIPLLVAAWALWVILSDKRRSSTESAA